MIYLNSLRFCRFFSNLFFSVFYFKNVRVFLNNHITRGLRYVYHQRTIFPHPIGIVIGQKVVLGRNCVIYQNVTIGAKNTKDYKNAEYPVIEDEVIIYPNSIIIGKVKIGKGAVVGAGSLVLKDVEPGSVVAGVPAVRIK